MSTDFSTLNFGGPAPAMATLKGLVKNAYIVSRGFTGDANLVNLMGHYQRAREVWAPAMDIAAALVANDQSFSTSNLDALNDSNLA